jgi:preprotein translocase subunit YajC
MADQAEATPRPTTSVPPAPPGQPGAQPPQGGFDSLLLMLVAMGLIFYFLLIRPESKRRKEKEALLNALKTKDKVVTIGGLHGTVVEVDGDEVVLLVDPKKDVKLRFRRSSVEAIEASEDREKDKR